MATPLPPFVDGSHSAPHLAIFTPLCGDALPGLAANNAKAEAVSFTRYIKVIEGGEQGVWMERAGERPGVGETGFARDAGLVHAGLAGDQMALEQLFRPHERSLVSLCFGILGSAE